MVKVYGVLGRTTALVRIPANSGKAYLEIEFKRGRIGYGRNNQAATYSTADKTEQEIIENSPYFGRLIKLLRVYNKDGASVAPAAATEKAAGAKVEKTSVPEVTTQEEAVSYLKSKGAKATNLRSAETIKAFADKIGVSFPNLNL